MEFVFLTKTCPFIITPVSGSELTVLNDKTAVIKRVVIDEDVIEVYCTYRVSPISESLEEVVKGLKSVGWRDEL